ncbi:hypothetical protein EAE96_003103 [Botrytis aclada]|nr:hypothetical protein EAE96_003103 [Botrytis aclada]
MTKWERRRSRCNGDRREDIFKVMPDTGQQRMFRAASVCTESGHSQSSPLSYLVCAESVLLLVQSCQGSRSM